MTIRIYMLTDVLTCMADMSDTELWTGKLKTAAEQHRAEQNDIVQWAF